jgi:hypothetical protein
MFIIVMYCSSSTTLICVQKHTNSRSSKKAQKTSKNAKNGHFGIWRVPPFCRVKIAVFAKILMGSIYTPTPKMGGKFRKIDKSKKAQKRPFLTIFWTPTLSRFSLSSSLLHCHHCHRCNVLYIYLYHHCHRHSYTSCWWSKKRALKRALIFVPTQGLLSV